MSGPRYSYRILMKPAFSIYIVEKCSLKNFRKIRSMRTDRRRQRYMTKLLIAFRNLAKSPNENDSAKNLHAEWKEHSVYTLCVVIHVSLKYHRLYILGRLFFKTYVTVKLRERSGDKL
jgi:hypothetical protein